MGDKANILDTLAREELGIDPGELGGSPYESVFMSFLLFTIGAVFPIFPFFFWSWINAIYISLIVSAIGLFVIDAGITLMTGRGLLFSDFRQVLVDILAAALTHWIGNLIGVSLG